MAKRSEPSLGGDKAKVRVFFAEVEGNNDSVQEALKTMVSAMSRPVRVIAEQKATGRTGVFLQESDTVELDEEPGGDEEIPSEEEPGTGGPRKSRGTGKKTDRNAGLALVPDLNFRPAAKQSLKEFVERKGPTTDVETTLATVYFMQHSMELAKIGPSHVMTAFKEIGIPIPVDLKQTIRNIQKSKAWLKFTDIEDIRTTTQGENFVEHDMGKTE